MDKKPCAGTSPPFSDDSSRWDAVVRRDRRADGLFVYAVKSTGVYCRPTCASRRPKRENAVFFPSSTAASEAGYRPCKRCHPEQEASRQSGIVESVKRLIADGHCDAGHTSLAQLASSVQLSPTYLQRLFKAHTGLSPREYAEALRTGLLKEALRNGATVLDALYSVGYGSERALYESADRDLGMTPGSYRRGGDGVKIKYVLVDTAIGRMLLAATDRGICSLKLGKDEVLLTELRSEFPHAELVLDPQAMEAYSSPICSYLEGAQRRLDLALDVHPTAFQRIVWNAISSIPYGETRAYHQLAESIGRPTATRAVARACATNPVALVVPCHRVVGADGSLTGFRWGVDRKAALLDMERSAQSK